MKKKIITPALTSFSCRWRWRLQLQLQLLSTMSSSLTSSSLAVTAAGTTVAIVLIGVGVGCRCSCSSCRPLLALLQLLSLLAAGSSQIRVAFILVSWGGDGKKNSSARDLRDEGVGNRQGGPGGVVVDGN